MGKGPATLGSNPDQSIYLRLLLEFNWWSNWNSNLSFYCEKKIENKSSKKLTRKLQLDRGGGQVVSLLAFNSDNRSSNPYEVYSFDDNSEN